MADSPPPLKKGGLHALSWWSLGLTVATLLFFVAGFVIAANMPKHSRGGEFCVALSYIVAPLCGIAAGITGAMGVKKRGNCLSLAVLLGPPLVIAAMVLFSWLALYAVSRFR